MEKDLHIEFKNRKIKKVNKFVAFVLISALKLICKRRKVKFEYTKEYLENDKKKGFILCQHRSTLDYMYIFAGTKRYDTHILVGYQNIFKRWIYGILKSIGVIAKMLYQPDVQSVVQIKQSLELGESVVIFPEGIQSTSGSSHPLNPGTVSLLMKYKIPVSFVEIEGSYFARTRYSTDLKKGPITVRYSLLFTPEDFEKYSKEELTERLNEKLYYNEFDVNKVKRNAYYGKKPNIYGLDNIIYKCPDCLGEHRFKIEGDRMECLDCGFAVTMDEYYDIHPLDCDLKFENIDLWYKWQRNLVREEVRDKGFSMKTKVQLRNINRRSLKENDGMVVEGEGILEINNKGLTYKGSRNGEETELHFEAKNVYSLTMSLAHELDLYDLGNYYNFLVLENEKQVVKWMLCAEEIHNMYDPVWRESSERVYQYE